MDATELAKTGLVGWREKVAASVAGPVSERTPLADEQVRAVMGGSFSHLPSTTLSGHCDAH
jgi:hypothetical protein